MMQTTRLHSRLSLPLVLAVGACGLSTDPDLDVAEGAGYLALLEDEAEDLGLEGLLDSGNTALADGLAEEDAEGAIEMDLDDDAAPGCSFEDFRGRILASYDLNGDGRLDEAEREALRADLAHLRPAAPRMPRLAKARRHVRFHLVRWAFDENGDGRLDRSEREALVEALKSRCEARQAWLLQTYDTNGNGALDPDEIAEARRARRARLAEAKEQFVGRYDRDGNGILDAAEREAARIDLRARWMARAADVKGAFDLDGDGRLSPDEIDAAKAAARERIANPRHPAA